MNTLADQPKNVSKAERTYTVALGVLAGLYVFGIVSMITLMNRPGIDDRGRFAFSLSRNMEVCFVVVSIAAILARFAPAAPRKWFSTVLNILLLFFIPFGTVMGIYGLRKLDKDSNQSPPS